jgi:hypothetical protein
MEIKYILAIFVISLIYCIVSYKQGYKSGFEEGKRHAIFTLKGDIKE